MVAFLNVSYWLFTSEDREQESLFSAMGVSIYFGARICDQIPKVNNMTKRIRGVSREHHQDMFYLPKWILLVCRIDSRRRTNSRRNAIQFPFVLSRQSIGDEDETIKTL